MPLPEGTVVDNRYVILHQLGVGGMGTVYKANDRELDRTVALKVIHVELIANEDARKRFAREGRVLASIQHPHVLQSYRVGFWQNKWPYIAMEFLQGHSLHQFANQPLPAARAINIAIQVCGSMQAAHQCGIVHRDLSINNIMLLDNHHNDYIKVIDFGLSFFSGKTTQSITETGALVGSLYYMSPEQCNGQKIDHRADIYALGCILFQLVAGVAPFQADNPIAMLKQHLHACAPPLNTLVPEHEIPVGLQSALCRAMNKNPEQRFQSMQDFQTELEAILRGEGLDVDVGEADAGAAKRLRRFGLVAAILCSAGLILTGYLYRLPDLSSAKVGKHPLYKRNKTESELQKMDSDSRIENHKEWLRCHTNEVSERAAYKAVSLAEEVQGSTPETAGKYLREAFAITHRWLEQSLEQEQYSQIQGATNLLQHLQ